MLRKVKSKENLMKMFNDETNYSKFKDVESYEHKESVAMFAEEMFDLCEKEIEMTPIPENDDDNNFDFRCCEQDGYFWLFKEEWLEPTYLIKPVEITIKIVTEDPNAEDIIRNSLFGKLDISEIEIKEIS